MCGITPFQGVSCPGCLWITDLIRRVFSLPLCSPAPSVVAPFPPFPVTLQFPEAFVWDLPGSSVGEERANWEPALVLVVNLTREGGEPAVATLPLQPSKPNSPPVCWKPLACINMCRHTHTHTNTQRSSLYSGVHCHKADRVYLHYN